MSWILDPNTYIKKQVMQERPDHQTTSLTLISITLLYQIHTKYREKRQTQRKYCLYKWFEIICMYLCEYFVTSYHPKSMF